MPPDTDGVRLDDGNVSELSLGGTSTRIPNESRTTTHERNRAMAGTLEVYQSHDRHETAYMKAVRGWVEPAVAGELTSGKRFRGPLRLLIQKASPGELFEKWL